MASDEIKLEEIVLAAWLHDVGKFAQRADISELYDKGLEGQYCKTTKDGKYTHQHVIYTEGFLSKYRDVLPDSVNGENVKNLAANHHNPSSYYDWIIAEACVFCLYEPLKLIPVLIIKIPGNPVPVLIRLITKQIISGSPLCGNIKLLTHFQNRILCQFLVHALYYAHKI